jgi:hypothetical protein
VGRAFSKLLLPSCVLGALAIGLTLAGCAGKDDRFGVLVRDVREGTLGFPTRTTLSISGNFSSLPVCQLADGTPVTVETFANGWARIGGLEPNKNYAFRCETSREIVSAEGRTLAATETMISDRGFSSSGEIVSGAVDCYLEGRVLDYHRGTGRLFGFSGGRFPCLTQFDGTRWRSIRLDANYRATLQPVPSADSVTFEDGTALLFDDDVDADSLNSRGVLRLWSCRGVCDSRSLWSRATLESMPSSGLAAARSVDGTRVAVAAITNTGSPRIRVAMCSSGSACGDATLWTVFSFTLLGLDSGLRRTEVRFDAAGNLWVMAPSSISPMLACRASAFPCTTLAAWRTGGVNAVGPNVNLVRQQRPAFSADASGLRFIGPVGGGTLPARAVVAAQCAATSDCTAVSGGKFTSFSTAVRTTNLFPTEFAFFHLGVGFVAAHYQTGNTPTPVRFQRCSGGFAQCSDPGSTLWGTAAVPADGLDHDSQQKGQQRGATDAIGEPFGIFVDEFNDFVYLVYLGA